MDTNTHNLYLIKALDVYPWDLEKAIESLNYALSYEPENTQALALMGKIQTELFKDNKAAKHYYDLAIASKMEFTAMYPDYINVLIRNEEYEVAQKVIAFAMTLQGADKGLLTLCKAQIFEKQEAYKEAKLALKEACQYALNNDFFDFVDNELIRIKKKKTYKEKLEKAANKTLQKEIQKNKVETSWFKNRLNNLL